MKQIANKKSLKYLPMRNLLILLCPFFVTTSLLAQDATIAYRDTDDIFIGKIETGTNAPLPPPSETFNFMKSYSLKIRWRTYLGEPLERYEFGWKRNNGYTINVDGEQRTIIEDSLRKYPDLIDRFDRIRPTRVDIKLEGTAGGRTKNEMGAFGVGRINIPGEGTVDFVSYNYIVKDDDLLIDESGFPKMQWVDSAPETWNEFLNWKGGFKFFNMPTNEFKRLSREEQSKRIKDIKSIWKQINAISISGSIENIEWPELEMIDIIKTYDRYKNKKKEPSPQEKLEKALAKVENTPEYTKNDDWGELPEIKKEINKDHGIIVSTDLDILKKQTKYGPFDTNQDYYDDYWYYYQFVYEDSGKRAGNFFDVQKQFSNLLRKNNTKIYKNIEYNAMRVINDNIFIYHYRTTNFRAYIIYNTNDGKIYESDSKYGYIKFIQKISKEGDVLTINYTRMDETGWQKSNRNIYNSEYYSKYQNVLLNLIEKGKEYFFLYESVRYIDTNTDVYKVLVYDEFFTEIGHFYINRWSHLYLLQPTEITKNDIRKHYEKYGY